MRVKDPSRANPEKTKRSKRPNRPQDEDSSDDIAGKYIKWCFALRLRANNFHVDWWKPQLIGTRKHLYCLNSQQCTFSQVFTLWLLHCMTVLKGWSSMTTISEHRDSLFLCMEDQMHGRGMCGWAGSFWLSWEAKRKHTESRSRFELQSEGLWLCRDGIG